MSKASSNLQRAAAGLKVGHSVDPGHLETFLPGDAKFADDVWNANAWSRRPDAGRTQNLDFAQIPHAELRDATKLIILKRRAEKGIGSSSAYPTIKAATALGHVLGARPLVTMSTLDAKAAERRLLSVSAAYLVNLAALVNDLRRLYGLAVHYKVPKTAEVRHGTKGTEEGRREKRIQDALLLDLVALNVREDLPDDDRLFTSALALNLDCGWRVGELLALPSDCLFTDEGALFVRGFPSKDGRVAPKPVAPALTSMVEKAVATILEITEPGRNIVRTWASEDAPVWSKVVKDERALLYFAQKLLHDWTADPEHRLINPDAAWHRDRGWIDVLGEIDRHPSGRQAHLALDLDWGTFTDLKRQQQEAQRGRLWSRMADPSAARWLRDARVCDRFTLFRLMGFATGQKHHTPEIKALVLEALDYQRTGAIMPLPARDDDLEVRYGRSRPVLLRGRDGSPILHVDEALFVIPKRFIGSHKTKSDDWQAVTTEHLSQWLAGTSSRASVFERYGLLDPDTGNVAKFTSHQIRHWLETQYHRGGLTDAQIAAAMNRHDTQGNSVYNQMSNAERRRHVEEGIHEGAIGGVVAEIVKRADMTREEAAAILEARLRQVNVMPHGLCLKDLATEPCPHHMSCFAARNPSGAATACSHLVVDAGDELQRSAIRREHENAAAMVEMFEDDPELEESPQAEHFRAIMQTTGGFLTEKAP